MWRTFFALKKLSPFWSLTMNRILHPVIHRKMG